MLRELILNGVELAETQKTNLIRKVWQLKDLSPSEAFIEVKLNQRQDVYSLEIKVNNQEGTLRTSSRGMNLNDLVKECFGKIHHSLRDWKAIRFAEFSSIQNPFQENLKSL